MDTALSGASCSAACRATSCARPRRPFWSYQGARGTMPYVENAHRALDADRLARLLEVGRGLMAELQLEAVLDRLLETAAELTGARYAALGVLDADRVELARFITRGIDDETHRAIGELPRGRGIL